MTAARGRRGAGSVLPLRRSRPRPRSPRRSPRTSGSRGWRRWRGPRARTRAHGNGAPREPDRQRDEPHPERLRPESGPPEQISAPLEAEPRCRRQQRRQRAAAIAAARRRWSSSRAPRYTEIGHVTRSRYRLHRTTVSASVIVAKNPARVWGSTWYWWKCGPPSASCGSQPSRGECPLAMRSAAHCTHDTCAGRSLKRCAAWVSGQSTMALNTTATATTMPACQRGFFSRSTGRDGTGQRLSGSLRAGGT